MGSASGSAKEVTPMLVAAEPAACLLTETIGERGNFSEPLLLGKAVEGLGSGPKGTEISERQSQTTKRRAEGWGGVGMPRLAMNDTHSLAFRKVVSISLATHIRTPKYATRRNISLRRL